MEKKTKRPRKRKRNRKGGKRRIPKKKVCFHLVSWTRPTNQVALESIGLEHKHRMFRQNITQNCTTKGGRERKGGREKWKRNSEKTDSLNGTEKIKCEHILYIELFKCQHKSLHFSLPPFLFLSSFLHRFSPHSFTDSLSLFLYLCLFGSNFSQWTLNFCCQARREKNFNRHE